MTDRVWVRTNSKVRIYHTDPDCRKLQQAANCRQRDRDRLPDVARCCRLCDGTAEPGGVPKGESPRATRHQLEDLTPEDLGLGVGDD